MSEEITSKVVDQIISSKATGEVENVPVESIGKASLNEAVASSIVEGEKKVEEVPKDDERMSSRFASLARKEKLLVDREKQLKKDIEESGLYKKDIEGIKNNPIAFLEKYGVKLDDVLHSALGSKKEPSTDERISELQARIEQQEKDRVESLEKSKRENAEHNIKVFKDNIRKHVEDNSEKFELIKENDAYATVFEVVSEYFDKTGEVMTIEDATTKVEEYLEAHLEKLSRTKKFGSKFLQAKEDNKTIPSQTLTNRSAVNVSPTEPSKYLSREESLKKAAAFIKWND